MRIKLTSAGPPPSVFSSPALRALSVGIFLFGTRGNFQAASAGESASSPPSALFDTLYTRAAAAYQDGRYAAAIDDLLAAYKLAPEPRLLYNLAQAYRKLGERQKAEQFFRQYLETDPAIPAARRQEVARRLDELKEQAAVTPALIAPAVSPLSSPEKAKSDSARAPSFLKVAGSLMFVAGGGLVAAGAAFVALDGTCTAEPMAPALVCGRVYRLLAPGAAQLGIGGGLLLGGTLSVMIPHLRTARVRHDSVAAAR